MKDKNEKDEANNDPQDPTEALEKIISEGENNESPEVKAKSQLRKKRIIIVAIIAVILFGGVGVFLFMNKSSSSKSTAKKLEQSKEAVERDLYLDLEDFIINLNSPSTQPRFLKLSVSIEIGSENDKNQVIANMPKVRDSFQVYLRELRPEDLRGSQSLFRLREELLYRINKLLYPTVVKDILFNEIIVQ